MEEKQEEEFTIRDRRTSASQEASETREETPKEQPGSAEQKPVDNARTQEQKSAGTLSELDFSALVISLATTAQVSMGNIPNPQTSKPEQNLPAAQQMIDILGMLKEKTKSNLTREEQALLDNVLFNLRMQYVKVMEGKKETPLENRAL
jgi:hypothetical protein